MIQSALIARLLTVTNKVYASVAPMSAGLPVVTVDQESSTSDYHFGANAIQTGLTETDFEINVWAKHKDDTVILAQQIIDSLENFAGPLRSMESPQRVYNVAWIRITDNQSGFDGETELYQFSIFITIKH